MTNLSYLSNEWLELESDPGLFTLLIEDFGCKNVQVDEIYDLSKVGLIDGHVYGFIFLFKWAEERRSRNRSQMFINCNSQINGEPFEPYFVEDENLVNSIFFAHQITPNSCATHALLSVLLNSKNIELGDCLNRLKEITNSMDPESKGLAIGNMPELAKVHNLHASEIDTQEKRNKQPQTANKTNGFPRQANTDSFHFISFVNIKNRIYELDGLKKYPIDHGPVDENETFAEKFRRIILDRIPQQQQKENKLNSQLRKLQTDMNTPVNEIRYSLMAVVPDRRRENLKRIKLLESKRKMLLEILENIAERSKLPEPYEMHSYSKYSATLKESRPLEVNLNKLVVKELRYNHNSKFYTKSDDTTDYQLNCDDNNQNLRSDDGDSTDTCSECESTFNDDNDSSEDDKIQSMYAFKFVPLREQNRSTSQSSATTGSVVVKNASTIDQEACKDDLKIFSKDELIEFYGDYGFQDLLNILAKIEDEINLCNQNISEENDRRTKFYVDDTRRTHNYEDFITTYLLMVTEQGKLHEFINSKDNTRSSSMVTEQTIDSKMDENRPIEFLKEILTNYEDVLMDETELTVTNKDQQATIVSTSGPLTTNCKTINNTATIRSINMITNKNQSSDTSSSSPQQQAAIESDDQSVTKRKYPRRVSRPTIVPVVITNNNSKRKDRGK